MIPNFHQYDWIAISTSGGKDSVCMESVTVEEAHRQDFPLNRLVCVHATFPEEWEGTKELAAQQAAHFGLRFEVVSRKQGGYLDYVEARHLSLIARDKDAPPWSDSVNRWCTSDLKRGPISTLFTRLADEMREQMGSKYRTRILNCMGMRAGESCARAKLEPFKLNNVNTNGRRIVHDWLPLHDWTVEQVWERIRRENLPSHKAYELGLPRLSCVFCIFAPKAALMLAGKHNRPLLDKYVALEEKTGFSFKKELPLASIRDALDRGEEPGEVRTWEMP